MNFDEFKILHSETIMYYQVVEHDLKLIYAYMHEGDVNDNLDRVKNRTLGQMIDLLKTLDNENGQPSPKFKVQRKLAEIKKRMCK